MSARLGRLDYRSEHLDDSDHSRWSAIIGGSDWKLSVETLSEPKNKLVVACVSSSEAPVDVLLLGNLLVSLPRCSKGPLLPFRAHESPLRELLTLELDTENRRSPDPRTLEDIHELFHCQ